MQGTQVYGRSGYAQCCQHEEQTTRRGRDGMTGTWRQRVALCTAIIVSSLIMSVTTSMLVRDKKTWLPHPKGKSAWDVYFLLFFSGWTTVYVVSRWSKRQIVDCIGNDYEICFPRGNLSKVYFFATYIRQFLQPILDYSFV